MTTRRIYVWKNGDELKRFIISAKPSQVPLQSLLLLPVNEQPEYHTCFYCRLWIELWKMGREDVYNTDITVEYRDIERSV